MRFLVYLLLLLPTYAVPETPTLRVAVIDSGLSLEDHRFKNLLCKEGHSDFTNTEMDDNIGHGTHVVGLIKKHAEYSNYCLVIYKYINKLTDESMTNYLQAIQAAVHDGANIINISGGGSFQSNFEKKLILRNPQIKFIVAAGNNGKDLEKDPYYPASYKLQNIIAVGGLEKDGKTKYNLSNYGPTIKVWEIARSVYSTLPGGNSGYMTGTSQATAITTGKYIKNVSRY